MQAIEKPEPTETRQKTFSVLLIDDDADILTIFKHSLAQAGMHTYGFTNPMLAVKQIRPDIKVAFAASFDITKSEFDKVFPSTEADAFITKPVKPSMSTEVISVLQHTLQGWCYKV